MEKNNIAWIFVRALGVYFLAQAFMNLFNLIVVASAQPMVRNMAKSPEQEKVLAMSGWINTGVTAIVVLCFIFLAYYCLRKGEFIHKLLMFRGSNEKT